MRRKTITLIIAVIAVVLIAVPLVLSQVTQMNQSVHVSGSFTYPTPTPSSTPTTQANVAFTMFFPNGTEISSLTNINEGNTVANSVGGGTSSNNEPNGIPIYFDWGSGFDSAYLALGVIVIKNTGNVPITVSAAMAGLTGNVPITDNPSDLPTYSAGVNSNAMILMTLEQQNVSSTSLPICTTSWLGYNDLGTNGVIGVGQYGWLGLHVVCTETPAFVNGVPSGSIGVVAESFTYSFSIVITANQS